MTDDSGAAPSFQRDVKALFREEDRAAMEGSFDLFDYDDVKENADAILEEVESGRMPCDVEWETQKVELFRSWMNTGMAE